MILITNDDGILAPGLAALHREMSRLDDCLAVAPDAERSAAGHAITMSLPLRVQEARHAQNRLFGYAVSGTPADCIKIALSTGLVPRPKLVVSGINQGSNVGTNILYSGTVSAATEAAILGLPAVAVSLDAFSGGNFKLAASITARIVRQVLKRGISPATLLNVNIPNLPASRLKGIRVTRQGVFRFEDKLVRRKDPHGRDYYWMAAAKRIYSKSVDFDDQALRQGYVSVTPIDFDMTAHALVPDIESWGLEKL